MKTDTKQKFYSDILLDLKNFSFKKMKKNIFILILVFALATSVLYHINTKTALEETITQLKTRLGEISILSYQNGSLKYGSNFEKNQTYYAKSFVDIVGGYSSPFGDGRSFKKLMAERIQNYAQDRYASPRATGNILRSHEGIDLFAPRGTLLYPVGIVGIVTNVVESEENFVEVDGIANRKGSKTTVAVDYGRVVRILYPQGIESLYAHLDTIFVKEGDIVYHNTPVARVGYSGNIKNSGKAPHLHLELRKASGESFNPEHRLHFAADSISLFEKLLRNVGF